MTYRQILKALTKFVEAQEWGHAPDTCFTPMATATALRERGQDHTSVLVEAGLFQIAIADLAWHLACEADHLDYVINGR